MHTYYAELLAPDAEHDATAFVLQEACGAEHLFDVGRSIPLRVFYACYPVPERRSLVGVDDDVVVDCLLADEFDLHTFFFLKEGSLNGELLRKELEGGETHRGESHNNLVPVRCRGAILYDLTDHC